MVEFFNKFWLSSTVGLLVGIAAVLWVRPTTSEGTVLLVVICFFSSVLVGQILSAIYKRKK